MSFDTLSYARRLKQAGVPEAQAEAMADATRELVFQDFATKGDIAALKGDVAILRSEIAATEQHLEQRIVGVEQRVTSLEQRIMAAIETMGLRLTVHMGGLIAIGVGILAAIIKLGHP